MEKQETKEKVEARLLFVMMLKEYVNYLSEIKGKDFNEKLQTQLEKDCELSTEELAKKYKPLWLKMKSDTDFDKYCKEKPLEECECGSANVKCIGLGSFDKEFDTQMYKWKCFTCGNFFESSINQKGESYENAKQN